MAKILGLDIGTNSIGWAVIDDTQNKILKTGSRIFPEGVEAKTIGTGDKEKSKNASRRDARQTRRGFYRHRLRRIKLFETLIELNMCPLSTEELAQWKTYDKKNGQEGKLFPNSQEFRKWLKLNPYEIRNKALNEDITLFEFGRILYHFIQRRGFLSTRKGKDEGAIFKGNDKMTGIDETQQQIKDSTLGSYLHSISYKDYQPYKTITDKEGKEVRVRGRYTLRDMYVAEFEAIWQRQAKDLGLDTMTKAIQKTRFISGSVFNNRNRKRIEDLQKRKGKANVKIEGNKITTFESIALKEFLAGKIDVNEEGELKHKSQESLVFYQRPLRSQKGLLAKCSIEGKRFFDKKNNKWRTIGPTPCPISHPDFEEFRALQFINNIEYGTKQRLDPNQQKMVLQLINRKDANFDFQLIPKELKLTYEVFNYDNKLKVAGNYTITRLQPLFKPDIWQKYKYDIWHCFYFYEDNDMLIEKLSSDFGLAEKFFDKARKVNLKDDYSSISLKAINNINPFLRKGYKYSDAVILGGVRNTFKSYNNDDLYDRWDNFKDSHKQIEKDIIDINKDKKNKEGEAIERIKQYLHNNYAFEENDKCFKKLYHHSQETEKQDLKSKLDTIENLRNPIVQQSLNEVRRLVNELIGEYKKTTPDFRFDRINVEFGRNLKVGKKQRQEISNRNKENNTKNDEARERLTEYGLRHSRENVHKYLLYREIELKNNGTVCCPYTNKTINITDLLGKENKFQIEHIFPHSTSLDDSFGNKTLCDATFNRLKGNKTPYQFYQENSSSELWGGAKTWKTIENRTFKLLPYPKAKRFTATKVDDNAGFIERQLNDTRYISKKTRDILNQICKDVRVMPGSLTSELRRLWGLNNILQPTQILDFKDAKIDSEATVKHWVVLDKDENPVGFYPLENKKPILTQNETTITGHVKDNKFNSKYVRTNIDATDCLDGKHWAVLKLGDKPNKIIKVFTDKPDCGEGEIILRGKIENKQFANDTIGTKIKINEEDGYYWIKFKVTNIKFEAPKEKKRPTKKAKQILLYGEAENTEFKSYIYECRIDKGDGKYWAILDLDMDNPEIFNAHNQKPEKNENEILIQGNINQFGVFASDIDYEHTVNIDMPLGKYWAVFDIEKANSRLLPVNNTPPIAEDKQRIIEGSVWVNKKSGEIIFDPKKNRDDHRHHAIDAIAIALTQQSYLQKLSTYNANKNEKFRGNKHDKPIFEMPWTSFLDDAKKAAAEILISHRADNKVLSKITKTVVKNGKKYTSSGFAARGQLHKESVFGSRQSPGSEKAYHIRKPLDGLKDNQIDKIVDTTIRNIVRNGRKEEKLLRDEIKRLTKIDKATKTEIEEQVVNNQINEVEQKIKLLYTLPNKNGERVPIRKVRIRENIGNAVQLKNRKIFAEKRNEYIELNQYVNPRNNHHVAIYRDENGKLYEQIVTFWEAIERKKQGLPILNKDLDNGSEFVTSLEINDMFLLGLNNDEINWSNPNYKLLKEHLFRIQKISSKDYYFRHHLASTIDNKTEEVRMSLIKWDSYTPIKVQITTLGKIKQK